MTLSFIEKTKKNKEYLRSTRELKDSRELWNLSQIKKKNGKLYISY